MTTIRINEPDMKSERREFVKCWERTELGDDRNLAVPGFRGHNWTHRQRQAAIRILRSMPNMRRRTMANGIRCSGQECERCQSSYRFVRGTFERLGLRQPHPGMRPTAFRRYGSTALLNRRPALTVGERATRPAR